MPEIIGFVLARSARFPRFLELLPLPARGRFPPPRAARAPTSRRSCNRRVGDRDGTRIISAPALRAPARPLGSKRHVPNRRVPDTSRPCIGNRESARRLPLEIPPASIVQPPPERALSPDVFHRARPRIPERGSSFWVCKQGEKTAGPEYGPSACE